MLDGVAGLVGGDADRGEIVAAVILRGERQDFLRRVVVVGEMSLDLLDRDVVDPRLSHHGLGRLAAGQPAPRGDPGIPVIGARDADLRVEGKNEDQDEEQDENTLGKIEKGERSGHGRNDVGQGKR